MMILKGIGASPGIVMGPAFILKDEGIVIQKSEIPKNKLRQEIKRFRDALERTHSDLDATEAKVLKTLGRQHAKLIDAHRLILNDPLITKDVVRRIEKEGVNAEFALSEAIESANQAFEKIQDEFFRERRHDLFDVGKRLLRHLMHQEHKTLAHLKEPSILISHNLLPSDVLSLREARVLGFATDLGGRTSHAAILAQGMGIPAVVGLSEITQRVRDKDFIILDGYEGILIIGPDAVTIERYRVIQEKYASETKALEELKNVPAVTKDGHWFSLAVNLDSPEELKYLLQQKAEGVGLFRSEFLYLNRPDPPDEEEQGHAYQQVVDSLYPHQVIIRTADIGGDRLIQIGILGHDSEVNPALGLRGVRLSLRYPELFLTQLRAILRASAKGTVKILFPMISSIEELREVKRLLESAHAELKKRNVPVTQTIEVGVMVEVPSAALTVDILLPHLDFLSIGTNDLIQYTLAVDRVNEYVAHLYDPFHPAVLRLLHQVVESAHQHGKWVGLCGEMASDPKAIPLLAGLSLDQLSVNPRALQKVKQILRTLNHSELRKRIQEALSLPDSKSIEALFHSS